MKYFAEEEGRPINTGGTTPFYSSFKSLIKFQWAHRETYFTMEIKTVNLSNDI